MIDFVSYLLSHWFYSVFRPSIHSLLKCIVFHLITIRWEINKDENFENQIDQHHSMNRIWERKKNESNKQFKFICQISKWKYFVFQWSQIEREWEKSNFKFVEWKLWTQEMWWSCNIFTFIFTFQCASSCPALTDTHTHTHIVWYEKNTNNIKILT